MSDNKSDEHSTNGSDIEHREEAFNDIIKNIQKSNIKVSVKQEVINFIKTFFRDNIDAKTTIRLYRKRLHEELAKSSATSSQTPTAETIPTEDVDSSSDEDQFLSPSETNLFEESETWTPTSVQRPEEPQFSTIEVPLSIEISKAIFSSTPLTSAVTHTSIPVSISPIVLQTTQTTSTPFSRTHTCSQPTSSIPNTSTPQTSSTSQTTVPQSTTTRSTSVQSSTIHSSAQFSHTQQSSTQNRRMATLTAADLTQITDIVTQSSQNNEPKLRVFSGSPKDAVSWMEDFEFQANANGWDDARKKSKLGGFLTGPGRAWFSLEIEGTNKD